MKKLIVANWKMYLTLSQSVALAKGITKSQIPNSKSKIVLCPSFIAMEEVSKVLRGTRIKLGAQDVGPEARGAFTGEVGLDDLREIGVQYVLVGHSERRRMFHESDVTINRKLRAVLSSGMRPILCVGEPQSVRRANQAHVYVAAQVRAGLRGVTKKDLKRVVIAYEPVWAIGTGRPDTPEDASKMHKWILKTVEKICGGRTSGQTEVRPHLVSILYGGSVNSKNARVFIRAPGVDGLLIGKASTGVREFMKIIKSLC